MEYKNFGKYLFCETIRKATKISPKLCPLFKGLYVEPCLLQSNTLGFLQILRTHRRNLLRLIFRRTLFSPPLLLALEKNLLLQLNTFLHLVEHLPSPPLPNSSSPLSIVEARQESPQAEQQECNRANSQLLTKGVLVSFSPWRGPWAAGRGVRQGGSEDWAWRGLYNALSSVVLELH